MKKNEVSRLEVEDGDERRTKNERSRAKVSSRLGEDVEVGERTE